MTASKEFFKDYATHAFVRFAYLGRPTAEEYAERIRREALRDLAYANPEAALRVAEKAVEGAKGRIYDIAAVNAVLAALEREGKQHVIDAVAAVYFVNPQGKPRRGAMQSRVRRFAIDYPASERTVCRWLKCARLLFALHRNLDIDREDERW